MQNIDLDNDFDFGFTTHSADEYVDTTLVTNKARQMYDAIMPLLDNLSKDSDTNDVIKWPNRAAKIKAFKTKLKTILDS